MNDNKMSKNPKKENKEINGIINGHNKKYIFDNKTMDFGEYLKLLKKVLTIGMNYTQCLNILK